MMEPNDFVKDVSLMDDLHLIDLFNAFHEGYVTDLTCSARIEFEKRIDLYEELYNSTVLEG